MNFPYRIIYATTYQIILGACNLSAHSGTPLPAEAPLQTIATHRQEADAYAGIELATTRLLTTLNVVDDGDYELRYPR